jgi:3-phenylpropionate/trans-cinnamate dioxygenase ferredoxin subunit
VGDGEIEGNEIICPRHGGRFDIHTGKATSLPALVDIPAYPVRVIIDKVEIGIPKE